MSIKFTKRHATCRWHTRSLWGSSGNNPNGQRISIYQTNIIPWILIWRLGRKIKFNFCVSWRVTSTSWTRRNRISKLTIISCAVTSSFRPKSTSPSTIWNLIGFYAIYIIINVMYGAVWWPCGWIWAWAGPSDSGFLRYMLSTAGPTRSSEGARGHVPRSIHRHTLWQPPMKASGPAVDNE